ncbi:AfsR/SARP family transcriptional regulator [Virgisporangium ochraceum]|uniref:SARP family transcriptional regulator n=1 Tax=Virgisporangium ochraceum TaxID=65505 RepID=A0A8J4A3G0_9ACTN|nr:BTAD domain-containing putative transcriptional regulator [Virgisporangium ochraceum]GIJ73523.1 SARP family transcriptional regulator [Virgisporangium ochraceum]
MEHGLSVVLLGAVTVRKGPATVPLHGPRQLRLLAALALDVGHVVTVDRLIDVVWPLDPPVTARRQVQDLVSRLRRDLVAAGCPGAVVRTVESGYLLDLPAEAVDASAFASKVAAARSIRDRDPQSAARELREALGWWQGEALAGLDCPALAPARVRLADLWLTASELRMDIELGLGRYHQILDELAALVQANPAHERLTIHYMRCLDLAGRPADALTAFHALRRHLDDGFGMRPGPETQSVYDAIAFRRAASPAAPAPPALVPAQLPPPPGCFAGRTAESATLTAWVRNPDRRTAVVIVGAGGVGKTALALSCCHGLTDDFPDGQLYADLRGWSVGGAVDADSVLRRFLGALGVDRDRVPADPDEAAGLYRSVLARRRVLILLDNAASAAQVRPLLPAGRSVVVVTSRNDLAGLVAREGARELRLDALAGGEAVDLLRAVIGAGRVDREHAVAVELAGLCSHLPLALRIAAAQVAAAPDRSLASYVARLRSGDALSILDLDDGPGSLRAIFRDSYLSAPPPARAMFRLLGTLPTVDFATASTAAAADLPVDAATDLLDLLVAAHLVRRRDGRYSMHDLLRAYAEETAQAEAGPGDRAGALRRLLDHYLTHADAAVRSLYPGRLRLPDKDSTPAALPDRVTASAWLNDEYANLVAAVVRAAAGEFAEYSWRLIDALRGFFPSRLDLTQARAAAAAALSAADRAGERHGAVIAHLCLAEISMESGDHPSMGTHLQESLRLAESVGWLDAQITIHGNYGAVLATQLELVAAEYHLGRGVALQQGYERMRPALLTNLGATLTLLGRFDEAAALKRTALEMYRRSGEREAQAQVLGTLADIECQRGRADLGRALAEEAAGILRELDAPRSEAVVLRTLAMVHSEAGRSADALACVTRALELAELCGNPQLIATVRTALGTVLVRGGRPQEAAEHFRLAIAVGSQSTWRTDPRQGLATALLALGDLDGARDHAQRALEFADRARAVVLSAAARATLDAVEAEAGAVGSPA